MIRRRASSRRTTTSTPPESGLPRRSPSSCPTKPSGAGSSRACCPARDRRGAGRRARGAVRRLAHVLRADRRFDPTVLVFEDLHWADNGLLDFIDHLLDWSKNFPILVVTLARPELLDRRHGWGAGRRASSGSRSSRSGSRDAGTARRPCAGAPGDGGRGRSSDAPVGSPSTPSRPFACSLAEGRLEPRRRRLPPGGDLVGVARPGEPPGPGRGSPRRPGPGRPIPPAGRLGAGPDVRDRPPSQPSPGRPRRPSSHACATSPGARCSRWTRIPVRPSAGSTASPRR